MDKSSRHLHEIEREMDDLQRGFCVRLCCPSKARKTPSRRASVREGNDRPFDGRTTYSNERFRTLDENLQRLQHFNTLIENELHDQLQTLVCRGEEAFDGGSSSSLFRAI